MTALPLGVIAAVTVVESPGAIVGSVSWSNLTVQSVGVVAVIFTASSGSAVTGDYNLTVKAGNDQANQSLQYRFTVETSPIWAIVSLLIIVAIIGGLAWIFRTYGRR